MVYTRGEINIYFCSLANTEVIIVLLHWGTGERVALRRNLSTWRLKVFRAPSLNGVNTSAPWIAQSGTFYHTTKSHQTEKKLLEQFGMSCHC